MKATSIIITALLGAASSSALAQYTGPSTGKSIIPGTTKSAAPAAAATTVRALTASGKDDTMVSLQGRIIRHVGGDKYRFADSTGEMDLEIESEHWPANTPIDDKAEVRIMGEYDKGLVSKPKVEVERIEKVK